MQMLYHSDSFIVVQFDIPGDTPEQSAVARGGYEIVDKLARKEIYIEGLLAESFKTGVQALAERDPTPEDYDEFIGRYTVLAQQPLVAH
ncbi:MAG: DUF3567 domain-containing protein [Rubrivivax sp.]